MASAATASKDVPILFSGPMIPPLRERRKTRSRRLSESWLQVKRGDHLWVRETLIRLVDGKWHYAADHAPVMVAKEDETAMRVWAHHKQQIHCVSIHMPRWASRITLVATEDARRELLQDITEEEAEREGCPAVPPEIWYEGLKPMSDGSRERQRCRGLPPESWTEVRALELRDPLARTAREEFRSLWNSLHAKPGEIWEDNPKVVVLAFELAEGK